MAKALGARGRRSSCNPFRGHAPLQNENMLRNNSDGLAREGRGKLRAARLTLPLRRMGEASRFPFALRRRRGRDLPQKTQKWPSANTKHTEGRVRGAGCGGFGAGPGRAVSTNPPGGPTWGRRFSRKPLRGNVPSEDENMLRNNSSGPAREGKGKLRAARLTFPLRRMGGAPRFPFALRRQRGRDLPQNTQKRPSADTEHTGGRVRGAGCLVPGAVVSARGLVGRFR